MTNEEVHKELFDRVNALKRCNAIWNTVLSAAERWRE